VDDDDYYYLNLICMYKSSVKYEYVYKYHLKTNVVARIILKCISKK
jgi:hypothetical protein